MTDDDGHATTTPQVSGVLLRVLADVVKRFGLSPSALFEGEARRFMTHEPVEVRVPLPEYLALLGRAVELTGDPAIGLRCGFQASESAFDLFAPLVAHVRNLRQALSEVRQFMGLAFEGVSVHLTERGGVACIRWGYPRLDEASDRMLTEFLMSGTTRMLREFGGTRDDLHAARFEHRRPAYHHVYTEVFEGAERFSESFTAIELAASALDRPHLHANPALQNVVRTEAEQRIARLARPASVVDHLRTYLLNQPATSVPDMQAAARALGVSVRSLRRRLTEAGKSYRDLTREMQRDRACALLRNRDYTLQQVAAALGFTDAAGFHRAFKRWTGMTAAEYRNTH